MFPKTILLALVGAATTVVAAPTFNGMPPLFLLTLDVC